MQKNINDFIFTLRIQRQLSKNTLISYRRDIESFKLYLEKNSLTCWTEVNEKQVQAYIASRFRSGITGRSLQRALSAMRMFYEYLIQQKKAVINPAKQIRAPKPITKLPSYFMAKQLLTHECDTSLNIRDEAMFELFYSSGLRLIELVSINLVDLDIAESQVRVTGKGKKIRVVTVGKQTIVALSEWLSFRVDFVKEPTQALFLNRQGRRISQRSVQLRLKQWAKAQDVELNVQPHMIKHSLAGRMLEGGSDIHAVQGFLGHEDVSSSQIYTHIDFQQLASVYERAHPRARKNKA